MIKRLLRWIAIALTGLIALAVVAYAVIYFVSERVLHRRYDVPTATLLVPTDPASIAEGQRLATVRGCVAGCHGKRGEGAVMLDNPLIARVVAPNLTTAVRKYSDAELAVIIRRGVRPGGLSTVVMPAEAFAGLTDSDLGRTVAFLRSLPLVDGPGPDVTLGPLGRIGLAVGQFKMTAQQVAEAVAPPEATAAEAVYGRYLAGSICAQCHGTNLRGFSTPDFTAPSLQVVNAYPADAFSQLMRTGVALGGRSLGAMGPWARATLSQLTDSELAALYSYLHAMP